MLVGSTRKLGQVVLRIRIALAWFHLFVFAHIKLLYIPKCPNTWLCISLQTASSISKTLEKCCIRFFLVQDSLSPELS